MNTIVKKEQLEILMANLPEINPLPYLKDLKDDKVLTADDTLTEEEKYLFGKKTGERVLPYLMQNRYTRDRKIQSIETIIIENDNLKAVFLPNFGGRLYSLYNKKTKRELLFKNPVIQPGNLAIRDAWIAGGIEWNIGLVGHSVTTFDTLFCSVCKDDEGNEFIRMYEFERHNRLYWQVDIHLPKDAEELCCYARIMNKNEEDAHLYWWSNTALPLTEKTRVFSNSDEIFYIKPFDFEKNESVYGHGKLPYVEAMSEKDVTYPENIDYSSEYFFQNSKEEDVPWEAAVYEDNHMFYECSTQPLRVRKMFTWGKMQGAENWQDFLSITDQGKYVEVQAGLTPSQLHGSIMEKNSEISFTQIFGGMYLDKDIDYTEKNYQNACKNVGNAIYNKIGKEKLFDMHQKFEGYKDLVPERNYYKGTEFGALEQEKSKVLAPTGMDFTTKTTNIWFELLKTNKFPLCDEKVMPANYMTDITWEDIFKSLEETELDNWAFWYYNCIFLFENNQVEEAFKAINTSLSILETPWSNFVKGSIIKKTGDKKQSIEFFEKAYDQGNEIFAGFAESLSEAYISNGCYQEAYDLYHKEKDNDITKRLLQNAAKAGLELGDFSLAEMLYETQVPGIREGESIYTSMWFELKARKYAKEQNVDYNEDILAKIQQEAKIPKEFDFRMNIPKFN